MNAPARPRKALRILGAFGSGYADHIASTHDGEIWQGGYPVFGEMLKRQGIDVLVLCAEELQVTSHAQAADLFPGVDVVCAPMNDDGTSGPTIAESKLAALAAHKVAGAVRLGKRVLVSCAMGRNRSGLVSGLALMVLSSMTGAEVVEYVRSRRARALSNESFAGFLKRVR